jgi:hypothetical protein
VRCCTIASCERRLHGIVCMPGAIRFAAVRFAATAAGVLLAAHVHTWLGVILGQAVAMTGPR